MIALALVAFSPLAAALWLAHKDEQSRRLRAGVTATETAGASASPPRPCGSAPSRGTTRRCLAGSANTKRL